DQFVQDSTDLVGIAAHQHAIFHGVGAQAAQFVDVLVQHLELLQARYRLAIGLTPEGSLLLDLGRTAHTCSYLGFPASADARISTSERAPCVFENSLPGFINSSLLPGSIRITAPPSNDSETILMNESAGNFTELSTVMCVTA